MNTAGTGAMLCAHCGRPAAVLVWLGGRGYHHECTRGPGFQAPRFEPLPARHYTVPMDDERVRQIVRQELALQAVRRGLRSPECWCEDCDTKANGGLRSRMSLCPECGDKRCPRAEHHSNACSKTPNVRAKPPEGSA